VQKRVVGERGRRSGKREKGAFAAGIDFLFNPIKKAALSYIYFQFGKV